MNWVKENWGVLAVVAAFCIGYVEFRIKENVDDTVGGIAFVSPDAFDTKIAAVEREIEANKERIDSNKENADRLDSKIERIVDILLEP